ncbi:MAG TPA: saccharopine dehydrogenase NADP-binding domain-containing protein [Anaerolineales bacterium]|nr:saccharopine dehydrogenase NADP-binding domain-containing protein [Anaerolineales bacterium]
MRNPQWMIYGATGYTGRLIAQEAVRRGHRPILAARSALKLAPLAEQLGLEHLVLDLSSNRVLAKAVTPYQAVLNAAGPYSSTGRLILDTCLLTQTHYLDINGEIPFLEYVLSQDQAARRKAITLLPGAGFDVVPTDCMAGYVTSQLTDPCYLDIAISGGSQASAGTRRSSLEILANGGQVRRSGRLMSFPLGFDGRNVRFADRSRPVIPVPWGDLSTAYYSTAVPNITTFMAFSPGSIRLLRGVGRAIPAILRWTRLRRWLQSRQGPSGKGPDPVSNQDHRSQIYVRAINGSGQIAQAWLETLDGYRFTAFSAVSCLETVLQKQAAGAFTPVQLLGMDWVLSVEHTRRLDTLPEHPSHPLAMSQPGRSS